LRPPAIYDAPDMDVVVRLFGAEAAALGRSEVALRLPGEATASSLQVALAAAEPRLAAHLPRARFAVNDEFVAPGHPIRPGDRVALIGLVSGG
jgi:molybdopterin converting factor small subunit